MNPINRTFAAYRARALMFGLALTTLSAPGLAHQPPGGEGAPEGILRATIVAEGDIEGMSAMVLDAPKPALMIRYHGETPLIVYDSSKQPFLRFTQDRVEASTASSHWQALPQSEGHPEGEQPRWVVVSGSGSYGWVDPRLTTEGDALAGTSRQWRIPLSHGDQHESAITGKLQWRAIAAHDTGRTPGH